MSQAAGTLRVDRLPDPFETAGEWTKLDAACGNPFTSRQWASSTSRAATRPGSGHRSGFVLTVQTIREAIESGVGAYKFLMGTEEYKGRFATDEPAVETLALTRGARGRLALGLASLRSRIR